LGFQGYVHRVRAHKNLTKKGSSQAGSPVKAKQEPEDENERRRNNHIAGLKKRTRPATETTSKRTKRGQAKRRAP